MQGQWKSKCTFARRDFHRVAYAWGSNGELRRDCDAKVPHWRAPSAIVRLRSGSVPAPERCSRAPETRKSVKPWGSSGDLAPPGAPVQAEMRHRVRPARRRTSGSDSRCEHRGRARRRAVTPGCSYSRLRRSGQGTIARGRLISRSMPAQPSTRPLPPRRERPRIGAEPTKAFGAFPPRRFRSESPQHASRRSCRPRPTRTARP